MKRRHLLYAAVMMMYIACAPSGENLTVMTYNIRYAHEDPNGWDGRKGPICEQLSHLNPMVVGFQEATEVQIDDLSTCLTSYAWTGIGRNGTDTSDPGEYVPIFYDTSRIELKHGATFWLSETPSLPLKSWDAALPRVCTYGLFRQKSTHEEFYVFNVHFDHIGQNARLNSARMIIDSILPKSEFPSYVIGDFNAEPTGEVYRILTKNLKDAARVKNEDASSIPGTFNGFDKSKAWNRRIDFIFINDHVNLIEHSILIDTPRGKLISDHFPILVSTIHCEP